MFYQKRVNGINCMYLNVVADFLLQHGLQHMYKLCFFGNLKLLHFVLDIIVVFISMSVWEQLVCQNLYKLSVGW